MKISTETIELRLRHTFTIARSSRTHVPVVILTIEHGGLCGYGEASPSTRYGETPETVLSFLSTLERGLPADPGDLPGSFPASAEGNRSAVAAIDIAVHDLAAKSRNLPVWRMLGLPEPVPRPTSLTIGIDTPEVMRQKVREAASFRVLKVKAGIEDDIRLIELIRKSTDKPIRVDANEGWKSREVALEKVRALAELGVEFIEQPMPSSCLGDIAWLREKVDVPFIADESLRTAEDIPALRDAFDGINIKLMKCGGLGPACALIDAAHKASMKVMLGCMIETSVGISAAAQLLGTAEYVDLDGNLLISNDPFTGAVADSGMLYASSGSGIGVARRPA